MLYKYSMKFS